MKRRLLPLLLLASLATARPAVAQTPDAVALSLTVLRQGSISSNSITTAVGAPVRSRLTGADLLTRLALDGRAAGNYSATNFPEGSKLVYNAGFVVEDSRGNQLFDASGIMKLEFGTNYVVTGVARNDGKLPFVETTRSLVTLSYDATQTGGKFAFRASGVGTLAYRAIKADSHGNSREISNLTASIAGDGTDAQGNAAVLTGSVEIAISTTASSTESFPAPGSASATLLAASQGISLSGGAEGGVTVTGHQGNTNSPPPPLPVVLPR